MRLDALLSGQTGDLLTLKNGVVAWLDATDLRIGKPEQDPFDLPLPEQGTVRLPKGTLTTERVDHASFPCGRFDAYVDADRMHGAFTVRSPKAGDRFTPFGMRGTKLLSDYFTDRKTPRFERQAPIVCDADGIVWVAGFTIDERVRVTAQTVHIYHYHYEEA